MRTTSSRFTPRASVTGSTLAVAHDWAQGSPELLRALADLRENELAMAILESRPCLVICTHDVRTDERRIQVRSLLGEEITLEGADVDDGGSIETLHRGTVVVIEERWLILMDVTETHCWTASYPTGRRHTVGTAGPH